MLAMALLGQVIHGLRLCSTGRRLDGLAIDGEHNHIALGSSCVNTTAGWIVKGFGTSTAAPSGKGAFKGKPGKNGKGKGKGGKKGKGRNGFPL